MDDKTTRRGIETMMRKSLVSLLNRTQNINGLDESLEVAVLVKHKVRERENKRGRTALTAPLLTRTTIISRNEIVFQSLIDSYDPNANNSNTTFVYSDQLDEPAVSEIEQSSAVPTNNIDEEDVIESLLRLNQENISPDSEDEPEWMQQLAT
jgi:hypothetical protein